MPKLGDGVRERPSGYKRLSKVTTKDSHGHVRRLCQGRCNRTLMLNSTNFHKDGHGGFYGKCKRCRAIDYQERMGRAFIRITQQASADDRG